MPRVHSLITPVGGSLSHNSGRTNWGTKANHDKMEWKLGPSVLVTLIANVTFCVLNILEIYSMIK